MASTKRRAGRTRTFSVSVDAATKAQLQAAADRHHGGNMSRLFTAVARRLTEDEDFARAWSWYGGAPPTAEEVAAIDAWIDRVAGAGADEPPRKARRRKRAA